MEFVTDLELALLSPAKQREYAKQCRIACEEVRLAWIEAQKYCNHGIDKPAHKDSLTTRNKCQFCELLYDI